MSESPIVLLLVDHDLDEAERIRSGLGGGGERPFLMEIASSEAAGIERLAAGGIDAVLLALDTAEGGAAAVARACERAPDVPVVAILARGDPETIAALEAAGAQDVVDAIDLEGPTLGRAVRFALERSRMLGELHRRAVVDELTGLPNARGFEQLAVHHLRLADRTKEPVVLVFVRIEDLRSVRERYGTDEEIRLITTTAQVLRKTVRRSDILARVGTDAFCPLLTGSAIGVETLVLSRLVEEIATHNARSDRPRTLSLSVGAAEYDPAHPGDLADLMREADGRMQATARKNAT